MSELEAFDPRAMIDRLRLMAENAGPVHDDSWRQTKRERLQSLDVDPEHVKLALATPDCPVIDGHIGSIAAARAAARFLVSPIRLLVLGGPTGRGKTVAATWLAASLDACWWISAKDIRVGEAWTQAYARAAKAGALIVDDAGQESNEWAAKELGSLLESRFDKGRRTVVTTNLGGAAYAQRYGDRLASRLSAKEKSAFVVCGGADLRKDK